MGDTAGASEKKKTGALTTPLRKTEPIGTATARAATIEIVLQRPSKSPFVKHPVTSQVFIAARCTFEGDLKGPIEERAELKADGVSKLVIALSRDEASALAAVEVWAEPYGYAALLDAKNGKLSLGRLRFDKPLAGAQQNHAICEVHVLDSVVAFIAGEMNRNSRASDVAACRNANHAARKAQAEAEGLRKEATNVGFLKAGILLNAASAMEQSAATQKMAANAMFAYRVHTDSGAMSLIPGGEWDHKPRIAPVWGEKNRLGDSDKVYFYDIWSNLHFGYVGRAAGFTLDELLGGSDVQQKADHGAGDESADKSSVREGFNLYDSRSEVSISVARILGVVAAHDDWTYQRREREWSAAKGKK